MYESELRFLQRVLNQLNIPFLVVPANADMLPALDMGIRGAIGNAQEAFREWSGRMRNLLRENVIFYISDEFLCRYVALMLPGGREVLVVGPYITVNVDQRWLQEFMKQTGLHENWLPMLENYYQRVRPVESEHMLFAALQALAEHMWGPGQYTTERLERGIPESWEPVSKDPDPKLRDDILGRIQIIEQRYEVENRMMELVRQGRTQKVQMMLSRFSSAAMEQRTNPSRDIKNYTIILSTLMRKAVEQGGVHPVYIDRVSSDVAKQIEKTHDLESLRTLWQEMARSYCLLVRKHQTAKYPPLVQKVISRIDFDLTADLSLRATARALNVNPSYLSNLFKKETGQTLTDYVSRKRMEQAAYLLSTTNLSVSAVAQNCGISDDNYFTKLFKRYNGKSPRQFRQDRFFGGKKEM